ncbi:14829_t:CDS:1, partial [Entrophospora sp. SA101]
KHNKEETVGRRVRKCENVPRNKDDCFATLEEEWYPIDIETLTNLVDSVPRRIDTVKKSKGYPINYTKIDNPKISHF